MLCLSCQRQPVCIANRLAQNNLELTLLLEQLKTCEMQIPIIDPIALKRSAALSR